MKYPSQVLMTHLSDKRQIHLMIKKRNIIRKKNITKRKNNLKGVKHLSTVEVLVPHLPLDEVPVPHQPLDGVPVPHQPLDGVPVPHLPGVAMLCHPEGALPAEVLLCPLQREMAALQETPQPWGAHPRHPTCLGIA